MQCLGTPRRGAYRGLCFRLLFRFRGCRCCIPYGRYDDLFCAARHARHARTRPRRTALHVVKCCSTVCYCTYGDVCIALLSARGRRSQAVWFGCVCLAALSRRSGYNRDQLHLPLASRSWNDLVCASTRYPFPPNCTETGHVNNLFTTCEYVFPDFPCFDFADVVHCASGKGAVGHLLIPPICLVFEEHRLFCLGVARGADRL